MTENAVGLEPIRPAVDLFRPNCIAFWATTYNVDLGLFNEFLLGRLGEPPLNIVVMADRERVTSTLARIPAERVDQITVVNRRWLLRDVRIGTGRFHPKSYLAITPTRATLLVGSGNLSASGLDEGREVFTSFVSGTPTGDAAIGAWRSWVRQLVEAIDDVRLAERFADLEQKLGARPAIVEVGGPSLMHNLSRPLMDQYVGAVMARGRVPVDELLVAAPYFDREAVALGNLVERLAPRAISLYFTTSTSVEGRHLARRLEGSGARVSAYTYEPDRFTHAKLLGVVAGADGWVLSGSANVSRAALTLVAGDGNVELAVLTSLARDEVRAVFIPPGVEALATDIGALAGLAYKTADEELVPFPVRLVRVTLLADGALEVHCSVPVEAGWQLDDLTSRSPVVERAGRTVTREPLSGRLVFLVDQDGAILSNRVVVEDPHELDAVLHARSQDRTDHPPELVEGDLNTPVGRALQWVHHNLVMDVTERTAARGGGGIGAGERESETDDDLWERLEREQLGRDPRAGTYRRLWHRRSGLEPDEPIIELLEAMRDRIRVSEQLGTGASPTTLLTLVLAHEPQSDDVAADGGQPPVRRWKPQTRIRVRARNVLRRWAAAQTDPRLLWIDPLAPAKNFEVIAGVFARLWLEIAVDPTRSELTSDDMNELWFDWLSPFVGSDRADGWLDHPDIAMSEVAERLSAGLPETVAGLCWLAVHEEDRGTTVRWQPVLKRALDHGLLEPTQATARFASTVTHESMNTGAIKGRLLKCIQFIDDPLWCERTGDEMDLDGLRLEEVSQGQEVGVRLRVRGVADPLIDPRVPQLIVAVRRYRRCDGVAIFADDEGWRLAVKTGVPAAFMSGGLGGREIDTNPVAAGVIEQMASSGDALGELFAIHEVA